MSADGNTVKKSHLALVPSLSATIDKVPDGEESPKLTEIELESNCDELFEDISLSPLGKYYGGLRNLDKHLRRYNEIKKPILMFVVPGDGEYDDLIDLIDEYLFGEDDLDPDDPEDYLYGFMPIPTPEIMVCIAKISPLVAVSFLETLTRNIFPILMFGPGGFVKLYENFVVE